MRKLKEKRKMSRTELREHIFRMLFRVEFNNAEEMKEQEQFYFDELEEATGKDQEYILNKYRAIDEKKEEIDKLLNEVTEGWKTSRMNRVDLTILRLATYEIKWDEDVPTGVAINEAVELAKKYSSDDGPAFVNGVLAKVAN
jgi:N utilization substance protein B